MSRYTYAGPFKNPVHDWYVKENNEGKYEIWIKHEREADGSAIADTKHTSAPTFDEDEEAHDYITERMSSSTKITIITLMKITMIYAAWKNMRRTKTNTDCELLAARSNHLAANAV